MRIAINARSILSINRTGIGRYTYHLIDSLGNFDRANQYWLYVQKNFWDTKRKTPNFSYPNFFIKRDFFGLGSSLKGADVFHSPSPAPLDVQCQRFIVTVHDMIYKTFPQSHTQETIELTEQYMKQAIAKADHIICVSQSTRQDLHRFLDFPKEKSSVIYNGVNHDAFYVLDRAARERAKELLAHKGISEPFILFTGTLEPRKNLAGVLEAFAHLRQNNKFNGKLVVVGRKGWMHQPTEDLMDRLNLRSQVIFLGYVTDEELRCLYNLTEVFIMPSFYEGFGFPILEAFCCGAPTITSHSSSCGEIAADAALTIDPHSSSEIAEAIVKLMENKTLKEQLSHRALLRAKEFSFLKTAQETLKVYEQVVS